MESKRYSSTLDLWRLYILYYCRARALLVYTYKTPTDIARRAHIPWFYFFHRTFGV